MIVKKFVIGGIDNNTYILSLPGRNDCIVIDPSGYDEIFDYLMENKFTKCYVLLTHAHFDHFAGLYDLNEGFDCEIYVHEGDLEKMSNPVRSYAFAFGVRQHNVPPTVVLKGGETFEAAGMEVKNLHVPGHSDGSVVYIIGGAAFTGDVLFRDSFGRTDFYDGSLEKLKKSLTEVLFSLPDDTVCYTGHGDDTTIGYEKKNNPIFNY